MHKRIVLERILKCTLKQLLHVSVQSPSSGNAYSSLLKLLLLSWADQVNFTVQKAWRALHFLMCIVKKGNKNTKSLAYVSLVRPILEYGAVCWDPYREYQISALDRVQNKAAKFAHNSGGSDWESLAQRRKVARMCAL